MPKTKKKFIDRKNAVTFHLVHRSQQDPLIVDETAPQHVLVPATTEKVDGKSRKEEQKKYGVFFDDDYNYLQHLRDANHTGFDWEAAPKRENLSASNEDPEENITETKIQLPSSVFQSEVEEDIGLLNKAAPRSGLCLDLDPDVVAAMDEDFNFDDPDNVLEDNFIEMANTSASEGESDVSSNPDSNASDEDDDEVASLNGSEFTFNEEETKSRFTNYSMSSSVMRRNDQLSLLDGRFEQLFASYDDSEIGALDCEEIEGYIPPDSALVMQCADEFEKQRATQLHETDKTLRLVESMYFDEDDNNVDIIDISNKQTEKWDCESILSTYSSLYNHPKLISEPQVPGRIRVSGRTGIPLDVLDCSGNKRLTAKSLAKLNSSHSSDDRAESVISTLSVLSIRPKDESPEEKKERKRAIKEYRKERRSERKANTLAFKDEKKRQEKVLLNNKANQQGIKIL